VAGCHTTPTLLLSFKYQTTWLGSWLTQIPYPGNPVTAFCQKHRPSDHHHYLRLLQKRYGTTIRIPHDNRASLRKYIKYIKRQSNIKKIEQFNETSKIMVWSKTLSSFISLTFALFSIIDICKLLCVYVKAVILNEDLIMIMKLLEVVDGGEHVHDSDGLIWIDSPRPDQQEPEYWGACGEVPHSL